MQNVKPRHSGWVVILRAWDIFLGAMQILIEFLGEHDDEEDTRFFTQLSDMLNEVKKNPRYYERFPVFLHAS